VTDQSRKIVMTVSADGVVVPKIIRPGPFNDELGLRIVREGLQPTDQLIINGLVRARPNAKGLARRRQDRADAGQDRPVSLKQAPDAALALLHRPPDLRRGPRDLITLIGGVAYFTLSVAQYPEIAPPTIVVTASYPGASAEVVSNPWRVLAQAINADASHLLGRLAGLRRRRPCSTNWAMSIGTERVTVARARLPSPCREPARAWSTPQSPASKTRPDAC